MSADSKASPDVNEPGFDPRRAIDPGRALIPAVVRLNEQRVERGFWPKIRKVAAKIPFAGDALAVWYCARDAETPAAVKGMMLAALAYFVLPADAIPDVLAGVGFTDDAAVFAALLALVGRHLKPRHKAEARAFLDRMARER
jgi:uncharacterized membrane protein YkvA (DUF1232 family)